MVEPISFYGRPFSVQNRRQESARRAYPDARVKIGTGKERLQGVWFPGGAAGAVPGGLGGFDAGLGPAARGPGHPHAGDAAVGPVCARHAAHVPQQVGSGGWTAGSMCRRSLDPLYFVFEGTLTKKIKKRFVIQENVTID